MITAAIAMSVKNASKEKTKCFILADPMVLTCERTCRPAQSVAMPARALSPLLLERARKPVGDPLRKPLADLDCEPLPEGGSDGVALLGREHVKPIRKPICNLLPQLVGKPLPDDAADGSALLGCERGKPVVCPRPNLS